MTPRSGLPGPPLGCLAWLGCAASLLLACDESQVWHAPDWSTARMQEQPRVDPFDPGVGAPPPFTRARDSVGPWTRPRTTRALVERGRHHFETICSACHGERGDGDSVVATRMLMRKPPSLLEPRIRSLSDDQLDGVIARGYGLMPPFAGDLGYEDRRATIAYVRALEVAQAVDVALLPPPLRADLEGTR